MRAGRSRTNLLTARSLQAYKLGGMNFIITRKNLNQFGVIFSIFALVLGSLMAFSGCKSGPQLESGGKYTYPVTNAATGEVTEQKDVALWTADQSFETAYNAIDTVFAAEQRNRQLFWSISPNIKHGVDKLRVEAQKVTIAYSAARADYIAHPSQSNFSTLQGVLEKAQQLVWAAQSAVSAVAGLSNAPPAGVTATNK